MPGHSVELYASVRGLEATTQSRRQRRGTLISSCQDLSQDPTRQALYGGVTAGLAHAFHAPGRTSGGADGVLLVGGGARSDTWGHLLAAWLGLPVMRPAAAEPAARDAALPVARVVDGILVRCPSAIEARPEPTRQPTVVDAAGHYARLILAGAA